MTFAEFGIDATRNKKLLGAIKGKVQGMIKNGAFAQDLASTVGRTEGRRSGLPSA